MLGPVNETSATVRSSREASRARTRERVLDAAAQVFASRGFAGASMEEIAAAAGFTRGAVYSNFADKAELFLAVLDEREERRAEEVRAIYRASATPAAFFAALAAAEAYRNDDAEQWLLLRLELWLYAIRNPEVRDAVVERNRRRIAALEPAVAGALEAEGIEPPRPVPEIAQVIQSLDDGVAVMQVLDPEGIRPDLFLDALGLLLESAAARDRERRRTRPSS